MIWCDRTFKSHIPKKKNQKLLNFSDLERTVPKSPPPSGRSANAGVNQFRKCCSFLCRRKDKRGLPHACLLIFVFTFTKHPKFDLTKAYSWKSEMSRAEMPNLRLFCFLRFSSFWLRHFSFWNFGFRLIGVRDIDFCWFGNWDFGLRVNDLRVLGFREMSCNLNTYIFTFIIQMAVELARRI